jgi:hypothetical protein
MWVHIPKQYCPSFQELGDLTSQLNLSSHKPELWLTLSGKPTARKSSWIGCKTRPWMKELFGQILPLSMANHGVAKLICSLEDSHVKISAIVERKLESKKGQGQGYTSTTSASWTKYVFVENVSGLLDNRAMGIVLGELAERGFDAEWGMFSAESVGSSHKRDRVFILAHSNDTGSSPLQPHPVTYRAEGIC